MKFLAFTDLHEDMKTLAKLVARAQKDDIDVVLTAGDYTTFENHNDKILKEFEKIGKPVVMIPGNHESPSTIAAAEKKYKNIINIHKTTWEFEGITFMGFGTGGFAKTDAEFRQVAKKWKKDITSKKTVLVTHGPPHNTKLDSLNGEFVGNQDYTSFVKDFQPALYICGHLHENAGKTDKIGKTICINPGWEGKVLEIK